MSLDFLLAILRLPLGMQEAVLGAEMLTLEIGTDMTVTKKSIDVKNMNVKNAMEDMNAMGNKKGMNMTVPTAEEATPDFNSEAVFQENRKKEYIPICLSFVN